MVQSTFELFDHECRRPEPTPEEVAERERLNALWDAEQQQRRAERERREGQERWRLEVERRASARKSYEEDLVWLRRELGSHMHVVVLSPFGRKKS